MSDHDLLGDDLSGFAAHKLVAARESMGYTASALQRELKLTTQVFTALEEGDLESLGAPVFARGYIRAYCGRVGLEPDPFIEHYNIAVGEVSTKRKSVVKSAGAATKNTVLKLNPQKASSLLTLLFRLILIAVLLSGVAYGVMQINWSGITASFTSDPEAPLVKEPPSLPPMQGDGESSSVPIPVPLSNSVESAPAEASSIQLNTPEEKPDTAPQVVAVQSSETIAKPDVVEVSQPDQVATKPVSSSGNDLVITFSEVSWVNIKDASDAALFNGLAAKGKKLELSGKAPLSVVIGRADAVGSITFNGSTVDLGPHTRKNVARITLSR